MGPKKDGPSSEPHLVEPLRSILSSHHPIGAMPSSSSRGIGARTASSSSALVKSDRGAKAPRSGLKDNRMARELLREAILPTDIKLMQAKCPGFHTHDSFDSLLQVRG